MAVLKVMPWGEDQGAYVLIEEADFDETVHTLYEEQPEKEEAEEVESEQKRRGRPPKVR
jgi:hypothetical protein